MKCVPVNRRHDALRCWRTVRSNIRCDNVTGVLVVYTVMKQLLLLTFMVFPSEAMAQDAQCVPERGAMVETIVPMRDQRPILLDRKAYRTGPGGHGKTERHRFISEHSRSVAYTDAPVLIGHGQTISQPFIVALMTHHAALKSDDTVPEVGTGTGYQAAVLARLVRKICTRSRLPHHSANPPRRC